MLLKARNTDKELYHSAISESQGFPWFSKGNIAYAKHKTPGLNIEHSFSLAVFATFLGLSLHALC